MHSPICKWCDSIVGYAEVAPGEVAPVRLGTFRVLLPNGNVVGGARVLHSSECPRGEMWIGRPWSEFAVPGQDAPEGDPICR